MKFARSFGIWLALSGLCIGNFASCAGGAEPTHGALSKQDIADFAWFDELGYPDLSRARLVRVATGRWSQRGDDPPENSYAHALLTEDKGETFTVFMLDLSTQTLTRTPADTPEHERVGYEAANIVEYGRAQVKQLTNPVEEVDAWRRFGERISERAEVFALARACAAQGESKLAHDLLAAAATFQDRRGEKPAQRGELRKQIAADFSHAQMWRAVLAFGNPDVPREQLRENFLRITKHFPDSPHHDRAKATTELLEKMIAEDKTRAARRDKAFDKLSKEEQIQELIFQLRDQNGQQWSQPGSCNIFLDPREENSPAARLVKLSYDAVPALIAVVDDNRFTRSVGYHRNFYFSHHVLRVGDCARTIIERIAGRGFYVRTYTNGAMVKDGEASEVKQQIEAWWKEFETKGERQMLIEAVERSDDNSPAQAAQLVEKYPDTALAPIRTAIDKSKDAWHRSRLVSVAARLKGDEVEPLLRQQLEKAPQLSVRVTAAQALLNRGHEDAIAPMIAAWQRVNREPTKPEDDDFAAGGIGGLIELLAGSGQAKAIRALGEDFDRHHVSRRLDIVEALKGYDGVVGDQVAINAAQVVLVAALEDTEERMGMSGSWDDKSFSDPRLCDMAAHVLSQRFPDDYSFDLNGSRRQRDQQVLKLRNTWRATQGLPALPAPMPRAIATVPDATVQPLLQLVAMNVGEDQQRAVGKILQLGPGALPAAKAFDEELPPDHAANAVMESLIQRLANMVQSPIIAEKSVAPDKAARAHLATMQDQPLTGEAFVKLLTALIADLPQGSEGGKLSADREGDDTGITLTVEFLPRAKEKRDPATGWSSHKRVRAGKENLLGSFGSSGYEYALKPASHDDLRKSIDEALATSPETVVEIRVSLREQR